MEPLLILISITIFFFIALIIWNRFKKNNRSDSDTTQESETKKGNETCCGMHEFCEKAKANKPVINYFDDEELDRFSLKEPHTYSEDEISEFKEIFYSILDEEKQQWQENLSARSIEIPSVLQKEFSDYMRQINPKNQYVSDNKQ